MIAQPSSLPTANTSQQGFVLIVGLVILGLLTMLALSSMRDTTIQEKMAGASRDSGLAFQAAESALRDAENCITGATIGCEFNEIVHDAHFAQDDDTFPAHNTLFDSTTWDAIDPPGEPTDLAGDPTLNYVIRKAGTVSGSGTATDIGLGGYGDSAATTSQAIYEITARGAGAGGAGQSVLRVYFRN